MKANEVTLSAFLVYKGFKVVKMKNNVYCVEEYKEILLHENFFGNQETCERGYAIDFCCLVLKMEYITAVSELLSFVEFQEKTIS